MLSLTTGGGPGPFSEGGITGDIHTHFKFDQLRYLPLRRFRRSPALHRLGPGAHRRGAPKDNIEQYVERVLAIPETEPIAYLPLSDYDPKTLRLKTDE